MTASRIFEAMRTMHWIVLSAGITGIALLAVFDSGVRKEATPVTLASVAVNSPDSFAASASIHRIDHIFVPASGPMLTLRQEPLDLPKITVKRTQHRSASTWEPSPYPADWRSHFDRMQQNRPITYDSSLTTPKVTFE